MGVDEDTEDNGHDHEGADADEDADDNEDDEDDDGAYNKFLNRASVNAEWVHEGSRWIRRYP